MNLVSELSKIMREKDFKTRRDAFMQTRDLHMTKEKKVKYADPIFELVNMLDPRSGYTPLNW